MAMSSLIPRMLAAMADMGGYTKDNTANAGKYSYSYEDFAQVDAIVTPALAAHGLAYRQAMQGFSHELNCPERLQSLVTYICDLETGDERPIDARAIVVSADPQANGSAETYARRYALKTAFRLTEADDDGAAAKRALTAKKAPQKAPQSPTAAKERLWNACKAKAAKDGLDAKQYLANLMKREDWADDDEAYSRMAFEIEASL